MIYALNLSEDGRILSVTYDEYAPPEQPRTDTQPDGDVSEYKYVDGEFVHEPLPKPPEPEPEPEPTPTEPTADEVLDVLLGLGGNANE